MQEHEFTNWQAFMLALIAAITAALPPTIIAVTALVSAVRHNRSCAKAYSDLNETMARITERLMLLTTVVHDLNEKSK